MASKTKSIIKKVTIDTTKPLVKEFVDRDHELLRYIEIMLPHQPRSQIRIISLFTSKDKKTSKYRVNWYQDTVSDGVVSVKKIAASRYIQIENTKSGLKITDLTIDKKPTI